MKNIVVIGGGTGTFNVLSGLKHYDFSITAILTTFDSGGSTGVLRDEFGTLPGGDVRRGLVALAPDGDDQFLRDLFQIRFSAPGSGLHDHSLGNLLLMAAEQVTDSRTEGIKKLGQLLSIQGQVLPISIDSANLCVRLENGQEILGEALIDVPEHDGSSRIQRAWLAPTPHINPEAAQAIEEAEAIIFGPGDLYTSIIVNTLVQGFEEALKKSSAKRLFVTNIVSKWGETHGLEAHEYVESLLSYIHEPMIDAVFVNTESLPEDIAKRYEQQHKKQVLFDEEEMKKRARTIITDNFMSTADVARHNADKIAAAINTYLQ